MRHISGLHTGLRTFSTSFSLSLDVFPRLRLCYDANATFYMTFNLPLIRVRASCEDAYLRRVMHGHMDIFTARSLPQAQATNRCKPFARCRRRTHNTHTNTKAVLYVAMA